MVRSKPLSKKQRGGGVDFKKYKQKVGRKLPPPKNETNTEIKSKAIILPEQSVASDKVGLAVSKKGLTLKELLQQTSHHNVKVRKDALLGIRDLLLKYPAELKLHKLAIIEKLRERINDDDKVVRETLYQLFKSVILPGCMEDNQGALISLVMAYIFNAMTHLSIDVRLMAFKFFDLIVQNYPPAFSLYAEKVMGSYIDILQKNQFHLEEKNKLKIALSGLVRCLSSLVSKKEGHSSRKDKAVLHAFDADVDIDSSGHIPIVAKLKDLVPVLINCFDGLILLSHLQPMLDAQSFDCLLSILQSLDLAVQYYHYEIGKCEEELCTSMHSVGCLKVDMPNEYFTLSLNKLFTGFPMQSTHHLSEKDDHRLFILNAVISQIFFTYSQWISPTPGLLNGFLKFLVDVLYKIGSGEQSDKAFYEKHLLSHVPFIPKLVSTVDWSWKHPLLQAFTLAFGHCYGNSAMKMACLKAVEEMLLSGQHTLNTDGGDADLVHFQKTWLKEIVLLLNSLGSRHPSYSHEVLRLQLRLGQIGISNSNLAEEYDQTQDELQKFFCIYSENGHVCYGPFMELPQECQEISICCLYYFSCLKDQLLASLALCCLSHSMEPSILHRIIEVLHSSFKAGHIQIADYISFFITLVSQYEVIPEMAHSKIEKEAVGSNYVTYRLLTNNICSLLSQMGDKSLFLLIIEEIVVDLISCKLPLENTCGLMRMLVAVDSKPTRLSDKNIILLSDIFLTYLIDLALYFPEDDDECTTSNKKSTWQYYFLPCFVLMDRCTSFLKCLIDKLESVTEESYQLLPSVTQVSFDYSRKINAVVSIFSTICKYVQLRGVFSSYKAEIDSILRKILVLQSSMAGKLSIEQEHKVQRAADRLKNMIGDKYRITSG